MLLPITIYDVNGRIISNQYASMTSSNVTIEMPKGVYILLIGNESIKVIL